VKGNVNMRVETGKIEMVRFGNARALAETAARDWVREMDQAAGKPQIYSVALSGGRIAKQFLEAAAALVKNGGYKLGKAGMQRAHFFWGDERCVPPGDAESNYRLAWEALLAPLGVSERQIHRVRGELAPERAAVEAAEELCRIAPANDDGQPVLDLIFLGMGEEGHVASLFPGESDAVIESGAVFRPVTATKPPPQRITLGYGAIAAARQVWVMASGAGKEGALRASLEAGGKTPLGRVLKLRDSTKILTDLAAG
jgi:6-phosphogluconolactonase